MVNLHCGPLLDLLDRMRLEFAKQRSMFDLPARRWYLPAVGPDALDLSVQFHGRVAGNPAGPAAGPQTQMAQNLVLAWLAGGRIMELKTVQVDDRVEISRPCIDAANAAAYDGPLADLGGEGRAQDDPATVNTGVGLPPYLDMGAYEFVPGTGGGVAADFDNDNDVDLEDFAVFMMCFNGPDQPPAPSCP